METTLISWDLLLDSSITNMLEDTRSNNKLKATIFFDRIKENLATSTYVKITGNCAILKEGHANRFIKPTLLGIST